jgi:hypothetical protein
MVLIVQLPGAATFAPAAAVASWSQFCQGPRKKSVLVKQLTNLLQDKKNN